MIQNTDLITAPWSVEGQPWGRFVGNLSGFAWIYTPVKRLVGFWLEVFFYVFVCSFCFLLVFGSCICLMMYVLYMIYDLHDVIFKDWHSDAFLVMYAVCRLLFSFFCSLISSGSWNSATCLDLVRCGCRRPPEAQDTSGGGVGILWISEDTNQGCLILMAEIQVTTWNVPKPIIGIESMR